MKGAGCDCATFLAEVLIACGLASREDLGVYSHDWFYHASEERYLLGLVRHAPEVLETVAHRSVQARPGDLVLTRTMRSTKFNHGGIVTRWPQVIQAIDPAVEEINASVHALWTYRTIAVFSPWAKS